MNMVIHRRCSFWLHGLAIGMFACSAFSVSAAPQDLPFDVAPYKQVRVIISADAKNEADDDFAVAHAVLTPTMKVKGLIAAHYARTAPMMQRDGQNSMLESYNELQHLMKVMGKTSIPVYRGAAQAMQKGEASAALSEGAKMLIAEALKTDSAPLFVLVMGPITDIAAALRAEPRIASKMTVVWIGGMPYPQGGWEYNMFNDPIAANEVFKSSVPLWQVPHNVYMSMRVSLAELAARVKPQGEVGAYLWQQMIDFNKMISAIVKDVPWPKSEVWVLGDNPSVALLLDDHEYHYTLRDAPLLNEDLTYAPQPGARQIRVYHAVDARFTLEDFYAKLMLSYGGKK
ncbi:inosine-uridine nucleoside N-ribohydrolase|uniref:Inosine-uridine nucleoside N-ribohydrolase n=2 Tax=Brenneria salicis TaxID=55214 RepID=A0A366I5M3_9GAMM|nr:nucleoside hydrolase [Brenneria salicis]NMN91917.1 inosine-uridine nucleoside N-ribohydrolase [Brenneria salicis ATCC 15712 = DSM 30166]RBP62862.1 inosine-uridine nucleoside N-ribohydrolase [Brenneria salicis ATCC 15712 = DSM 30166]